MRPDVTFIALDFANQNYFSNHISLMKHEQKVQVISVDKIPILRRVYSRRSFLTVPLEFIILFFILLKNKPKHIITAGPKIGFIVSVLSKTLKGTKHAHWFTGQVWATSSNPKTEVSYWVDFIISKLSNTLMCDGHSQSDFLKSHFSNITEIIVPKSGSINGLPPKYNNLPIVDRNYSEPLKLCFIGRKAKGKGLELIYHIGKVAKEKNLQIKILLAGPKDISFPDYENWKNAVQKDCDDITFLDVYVDSLDVLQQNHVLILPSEREGFGSIVIEAQACGLPVICSDIYGLKDSFIHNLTGFRCASIEDYISAIEKLMPKSSYEIFSKNARTLSENYYYKSFVLELKICYESAGVI